MAKSIKTSLLALLTLYCMHASGQASPEFINKLNGKWTSKVFESYKDYAMQRIFTINYPNFTFVSAQYENLGTTEPFLVQTMEGKITLLEKSNINSRAYNIDMTITKNTLAIKRDSPNLDKLRIKQCASINSTLDILANGCGYLGNQKSLTKVFYTVMLTENGQLSIGSWKPIPKSEALRPKNIVIYPLEKKP